MDEELVSSEWGEAAGEDKLRLKTEICTWAAYNRSKTNSSSGKRRRLHLLPYVGWGGLTRKGLGSSDDNSAIKRSPWQTCSVAPGQFQIGDLHTCSLLGSSIVLKLESSQLNISSSCIPSVAISVRLTLLIHNFVISPLISFNLASLPWCKVSAPSSWNATPFIWTFHVIYLKVPDNYIYWNNHQERDFTCYFVPCSAEHIFGAIFEVDRCLKSLLKIVFSIGIAKITTSVPTRYLPTTPRRKVWDQVT